MSKHTPGQWYWDFDRDGKASLRSDAAGEPIMGCSHYPSVEDRCLIAAAPDLLEALIEVTASLAWNAHGECRSISDGPLMPSDGAIEMAKAAIARAKGESQ